MTDLEKAQRDLALLWQALETWLDAETLWVVREWFNAQTKD